MLTRWNGWGDAGFSDLARQYDSLDRMTRQLNAMMGGAPPVGQREAPLARARMRLWEHEDRFVLSAEVPGYREEDIELSVTRDSVSIKGRRAIDVPDGFRAERRERATSELANAFRFSTPIAPDEVTASLDKGILTVTLPKAPEATPRRITVKTD